MQLKKILALKVIADYQSFSKAAVHLSVSQSLLSKYVTDLENEFGVRLLYRNGRGAQLTPEGIRLLDYTRRIENLISDASSELRGMSEVPSGTVVLGVSSAIGATLTIPVVAAVRRLHPSIHIQIADATSGYIHEWLNTGRLDLAVVFDTTSGSSSHENLVEEELMLASPAAANPSGAAVCAGADLKDLPFLLTRHGSKLRGVVDGYTHDLGFQLSPVAEIDSLTALVDGVEAGLGHTILPFGALRVALRSGRLSARRIASPALKRTIYLAVSTARVPTRAAKVVADIVKRQVAELDVQGVWRPADEALKAWVGEAPR